MRQALSYAIDRKALVETLGHGHGEPAVQLFPSSYEGYSQDWPATKYPFDVAKAKELLASAVQDPPVRPLRRGPPPYRLRKDPQAGTAETPPSRTRPAVATPPDPEARTPNTARRRSHVRHRHHRRRLRGGLERCSGRPGSR
ncbi:ABC transporter substrate-binding protein [Actinomadura viridis]|uniref:ABC transporter substrate-binding protein n=1 Tax=Actinomadura viridis TaxID=58110 RepID=UPI00367E403B